MDFFITRGGREHGPCTERELRAYLAYGSLKPDDLVRREGEEQWLPASSLPEFVAFSPDTHTTSQRLIARKPKPPGRIVRYRDYALVPEEKRAAVVVWRLASGLLFRPITLWRTASVVFTSNIYCRAKDKNGYQRIWPRWVEAPVAVLVIAHALFWGGFALWLVPRVKPYTRVIVEQARQALQDVKALSNGSHSE